MRIFNGNNRLLSDGIWDMFFNGWSDIAYIWLDLIPTRFNSLKLMRVIMADLIDRQEVIDMFQRMAYDDWNQGVNTTWANAFSEATDMIEDLSSVEAEPVRHGKWLTDNDTFKRMYLVCSLCKRATQTPWYVGGFLYDYCPNCGARMDGEQNG